MKKPKQQPQPTKAVQVQPRAPQFLASRAERENRFLEMAFASGQSTEPAGRLAG